MTIPFIALAAVVAVDFSKPTGELRRELHSSGFGPQICSCPMENIEAVRAMGFKASRTHDWALINPNERVCDYFHIFPLMHLDARDPANYVFGPTDYLLERTRSEVGHDIFYRLGTSIEHSGDQVHFNSLIPEDFDKIAEIFAGTIRHYNRSWANGKRWNIKYWEIWNEPDGVNNMWCLPDGDGGRGADAAAVQADREARDARRMEMFARFFAICLKRIKSEFPDVKVGGPAMCWMNEKYFREIFNACRDAGVAPDFISWHHYTGNPDKIMNAIERGRAICDEAGFPNCELIINEWHFFGEYSWSELRSPDPEVLRRVWSGPASHNGIDSSCFNLTMLSRFQTSKLDQAYYYGCRNIGPWGFMDEFKRKYKVYYGLKMFGDFLKAFQTICASSGSAGVTVLAARSRDCSRKGFIVTDYRAREKQIVVDVKGVESGSDTWVWIHDSENDYRRISAPLRGGKIVLDKNGADSAAFLVMF